MIDKEIIKALECCKMPVGSGSCNDCPFDYQRKKRLTSTDKSCTTLMFDYALDLINRQQAEIEKLKLQNGLMRSEREMHKLGASKLALKIKAEAIKEFAERLIMNVTINNTNDGYLDYAVDYNCLIEDIQDLVKEMVGEEHDKNSCN